MNALDEARTVVETLQLVRHPEGGFYRETFRAAVAVQTLHGLRAASTAILFLLPAHEFSAFHRVRSDEVWHHYLGDPVDLHCIEEERDSYTVVRLGPDLVRGERPQHVVPAGVWQAAVPVGCRFALCGCTVAPGFDFADFDMPSRAELVCRLPARREIVESLTRL